MKDSAKKKKVEFTLQLDRSGIPPAEARMEVDMSGDDDIRLPEEVKLVTTDRLKWQGKAELDATAGRLFFVRFIAPLGTKWSFTATSNGETLFSAKEQVTLSLREEFSARLK